MHYGFDLDLDEPGGSRSARDMRMRMMALRIFGQSASLVMGRVALGPVLLGWVWSWIRKSELRDWPTGAGAGAGSGVERRIHPDPSLAHDPQLVSSTSAGVRPGTRPTNNSG
jgi:hypothetical protein